MSIQQVKAWKRKKKYIYKIPIIIPRYVFHIGSCDFWEQLSLPKSVLLAGHMEFSRYISLQRTLNYILSLYFEMQFSLTSWNLSSFNHLQKKKNYLSPQAQPLGALNIDTSTPEAHISKISLVGMTDFNSFNICSEVLTELLTIYTIMNNFSPSLVQLKGHSHIWIWCLSQSLASLFCS